MQHPNSRPGTPNSKTLRRTERTPKTLKHEDQKRTGIKKGGTKMDVKKPPAVSVFGDGGMSVTVTRVRAGKVKRIAADNDGTGANGFHVLADDIEIQEKVDDIGVRNRYTAEALVNGPPGKSMPMKGKEGFYEKYGVPKAIQEKLDGAGYARSATLCNISVKDLRDMKFRPGDIATLKDIAKEWSEAGDT
ncbi:hypothetical protein C8J56DRAFT_1042959 [Mycena floridula]|nr:hypothetical protein C8J56DRAFT_1042959 [Mycena floridula]